MATGQLVFAQLMGLLPWSSFDRLVKLHRADHKVQRFSCRDQFYAMAFAQLCARQSLRDIEVNLAARSRDLYRMGFRCAGVARNTLAHANATRPWQLYADFCRVLIDQALPLYAQEPLGLDLQGAKVFALDWFWIRVVKMTNLLTLQPMPVQLVLRPNLDYRGFCGTIASGILRKGDPIVSLPSGRKSRVKSIDTFGCSV